MGTLGKWILFSLFCFIVFGCSDSSSPVSSDCTLNCNAENDSDSSKDSNEKSSSSVEKKDVVLKGKDTIYVDNAEKSQYYSEGVFCWTEGCEAKFQSSSSAKSSSSNKVSSSSSVNVIKSSSSIATSSSSKTLTQPPVFDKTNLTMKDSRDGENYTLVKIGSVYWMNENLRYAGSGGKAYDDDESLVPSYGRLYSYTDALVACPSGGRLPTKEESQLAIDEMEHNWYTFSGRNTAGKDYGNIDYQGYLWITGAMESTDENYAKYGSNPDNNHVAVWEKNYSGLEPAGFIDNPKTKGYGVRCVFENL